jgi:hypothetical protein
MTEARPPEAPETPAETKRRRRLALAWRLAVTLLILVGAVVVAGFLGHPGRLASQDDAFPETRAVPPAQAKVPEPLTPDRKRRMESEAVRHLLGGVLMRATEESDADHADPLNQDPAARRQFLADRFGLPFHYPRSALEEGVVPAGADVLMVFQHPENPKARMVMVRVRMGVEDALSAFQSAYTKDRWTVGDPEQNTEEGGGAARTDRGWLLRCRRGAEKRFVYFEERLSREETLAIVFDPGY